MCSRVHGSSSSSTTDSASQSSTGLTTAEKEQLDQLNDPAIKALFLQLKQALQDLRNGRSGAIDELPAHVKEQLAGMDAAGQQAFLEQLMQSLLNGDTSALGSTDSTRAVSSTAGTSSSSSGVLPDNFDYSQNLFSMQLGGDGSESGTSAALPGGPTFSAAQYASQNGNIAV